MRTRKGGVLENDVVIKSADQDAEIAARIKLARERLLRNKVAKAEKREEEPEPETPKDKIFETFKEQIDRILSNCTLEYLQRGAYGVVFKLTHYGDSGFIDVDTKKTTNVFVLKVQAIDFEISFKDDKIPLGNLERDTKRVTWEQLKNEVTLQKKLFENALKANIRPPCPTIIDYRGITLAELVPLLKKVSLTEKKIIFQDTQSRVELIDPSKYHEYNAGIVLMEYIPAVDILTIQNGKELPPEIDIDIKNKAFRAYCTALSLGIDQGDAKPANFLFDERGVITMVDFGIAEELPEDERIELDKYIKDAERTQDFTKLKKKLGKMQPELNRWLLVSPYTKPTPDQVVRFEPLKPVPIEDAMAEQCQRGLSNFTPFLEKVRPPDKPSQKEPVKHPKKEWTKAELDDLLYRERQERLRRLQDKEEELKQKAEDEKAESEKSKWGWFRRRGGKRTKDKRTRKRKTRRN